MSFLPWIAIFSAMPLMWSLTLRWWGAGLFGLGYCLAAMEGRFDLPALIPMGLLLVAAYAVSPARQRLVRYMGHAVFIGLAAGLILHWLPGFHNDRVIDRETLTPNAVPFTMYLNLDKPLIAFWLFLVIPWIRSPRPLRVSVMAAGCGLLILAVFCLSLALSLGLIVWEPKWPAISGLWLANNLFLVTITEEVLFRGYVQGGLERLFEERRWGGVLALCGATVLFSLAHISGGWLWVLFAGLAGVGYGLVYHFGGLLAAVGVHFGLNVLHFFLFTYPMIQHAGRS